MSQASLPLSTEAAHRPEEGGDNVSWWQKILQFDTLQALPLITLVLLLQSVDEIWYLRTPIMLMCIVGLVYQRLLQSTGYWFTVATMLGATVYLQWDALDNHKYLIVYWCLALTCTYSLAKCYQARSLAIISRLLLGLCMALAVVWKLATPDYVDGSFMEYTMLVDNRFLHFTDALTDLPREAFHYNRHAEALLTEGYLRGNTMDSVALKSSATVKSLAWFLTWWTVLIEGTIALLFLLPNRGKLHVVRNMALLMFAVTTYPIATVRGFGWILMLLGMAQCNEERDRYFRFGYLVAFLLIEIFTLPIRFMFD